MKEPNVKLQRWKIQLNEYDFDAEYIKGKTNKVADYLSRLHVNAITEGQDIPSDLVHYIAE